MSLDVWVCSVPLFKKGEENVYWPPLPPFIVFGKQYFDKKNDENGRFLQTPGKDIKSMNEFVMQPKNIK